MTTVKHFAFIYFMKDTPHKIREIVPYHVDYWNHHRPERYVGGPFADRTGGLISFEASSVAEADALIDEDPFSVHGLLEESWVKEWETEPQGLIESPQRVLKTVADARIDSICEPSVKAGEDGFDEY
jgi:uncharacterized protein YciI